MTDREALAAKDRIRAWAGEIGFAACRVARAEPPVGSGFLLDWLRRGMHAGMRYMERDPDGRCDPARILEGCRSILCLSVPYDARTTDPAARDPRLGRISRYAWGDDYHDVLKGMLEDLRSRIEGQWPGLRTRAAVDSSPVLEKAFAAAAGLGWMGKHTNIIDPGHGSWFFLAELFTTLDLPPDAPIADHCGSCSRCIEACPTGAIVEPYVLDAGRCISYWTIEHRGAIEPGIGDRMGNWIFGCDVCQDVCPWNESGEPAAFDPRFAPRSGLLGRAATDWAAVSAEEFTARMRGSAIKRAKHEGIARNAAVAVSNADRGSAGGESSEDARWGGSR